MAANDNTEFYWVKAGPKLEEGKVALWERGPAHPHEDYEKDGEVFVPADANNTPVKVGKTALVEQQIRAGVLEVVKEEGVDKDKAEKVAATAKEEPTVADK